MLQGFVRLPKVKTCPCQNCQKGLKHLHTLHHVCFVGGIAVNIPAQCGGYVSVAQNLRETANIIIQRKPARSETMPEAVQGHTGNAGKLQSPIVGATYIPNL